MSQTESLHVQSSSEQGRNVLDEDFPCDVEAAKCPSFDQISRIVGATWVDREDFVVADIHVWTKKVKQHMPSTEETLLIDTGEETSEVLIVQA